MALLNKRNFPYIHTQLPYPNSREPYIQHRTSSFLHQLKNWDDGFDYWYCEVFEGNAFDIYPINTLIDQETLNKIKNIDEKTFIYICNSHEAFLDNLIIPLYQTLVVKENIPPHKIIVANDAVDLNLIVKNYADVNGYGYFQVYYVAEFEASSSFEGLLSRLKNFQSLDVNKTYNKRFLNFNRRWRLHRPTLVAMMKGYGILDKGHVSLGDSDDNRNWSDVYDWIKGFHQSNEELTQLFTEIENDVVNLPPLYLDFEDLVTNRAMLETNNSTENLYKETLVSVVSETTFYTKGGFNPARFLSEKTFKPIVYGHPFIIVSVPNSLDAVKELGYQTFHPYIDESYDTELDDNLRLFKIIKEIKRIAEYTDDEVKDFIENITPIVKYNQDKIFSKTQASYDGSDHSVMQRNFMYKTL
jgi:hypothetical protein